MSDCKKKIDELEMMISRLSGLLESISSVYGHLSEEAIKQINAAVADSKEVINKNKEQ